MWDNLKIKQKIIFCLGGILLGFMAFGLMAFFQIRSVHNSANILASKKLPQVSSLTEVERNWHNAVLYYRTYTSDRRSVDYFQALSFLNETQKNLNFFESNLCEGNQGEGIVEIKQMVANFKNHIKKKHQQNELPNALALTNQIDKINVRCKDLIEQEIWSSVEMAHSNSDFALSSLKFLVGGFLIVFAICILISIALTRNFARPIKILVSHYKEMAIGSFPTLQTSKRKDEFGMLINSTQKNTLQFRNIIEKHQKVANLLQQISVKLDEKASNLTSITTNQANHAEELEETLVGVSQLVDQNVLDAKSSTDMFTKLSNDMVDNVLQIKETISIMQQLIAKTKIIREIATQTYVLSLNARVEAAKAGAAGRGFGVVAQGIRELAERAQLMSMETLDVSSKGMVLSDEVQVSLKGIEMELNSSVNLSKQILQASIEQGQDFKMVTSNLNVMNTGVKKTAINADEIGLYSTALLREAKELKCSLAFFKIEKILHDNNPLGLSNSTKEFVDFSMFKKSVKKREELVLAN